MLRKSLICALTVALLAGCAARKPISTLPQRPIPTQPAQPNTQPIGFPAGPSQPTTLPPAFPTGPGQPTTQPLAFPAQPNVTQTPNAPPSFSATPTAKRFTFASIPGWADGDHAPVLASLRIACEKLRGRAADESIGGIVFNGEPVFGRGGDWSPICASAQRTQSQGAKAFFEKWFEPVSINGSGETQASLFTAYFEPELNGSRTRGGPYQHPIYARPRDLTSAPYFDRRAIDNGALAGRGLELYWVDDPVASFFLHIQGSGRIRLPDGRVARVGYAGKNNRSYIAIGRTLVDWNEMTLEQVSAQSIKAWMRANPARRDELMQTNPSYVFFEDKPKLAADPSLGPIGSFGQPLPTMRAIAVDRSIYALGSPFWIDFESPLGPMQRLVIALDTGGAIKGPRRADFYFGSGDGAGQAAGATRSRGRLIALAPTAALRRVFRAGS